MRQLGFYSCFLFITLMLSGCVGKFAPYYTPGSSVASTGRIELASFDYAPAMEKKLASNQLEGIPLSMIYLDIPVSEHIQRGFMEEMKRAGIHHEQGGARLHAVIHRMLADHVSLGVHWMLDVEYRFELNNQPAYTTRITTDLNTHKFIKPVDAINRTIRQSFEQLLNDPQAKAIIERAEPGIMMKPLL